MDSDQKLLGLLIALFMFIAFVALSRIELPKTFTEVDVYADLNMQGHIDNNIWWSVDYFETNYTKIIYVHNPNDYDIKVDIYWESFPQEMTPFCVWIQSAPTNIKAGDLLEVRLFLLVHENPFKGNSSYQGDVLTQIKGEETK